MKDLLQAYFYGLLIPMAIVLASSLCLFFAMGLAISSYEWLGGRPGFFAVSLPDGENKLWLALVAFLLILNGIAGIRWGVLLSAEIQRGRERWSASVPAVVVKLGAINVLGLGVSLLLFLIFRML